jgi:hypothetical protein
MKILSKTIQKQNYFAPHSRPLRAVLGAGNLTKIMGAGYACKMYEIIYSGIFRLIFNVLGKGYCTNFPKILQ